MEHQTLSSSAPAVQTQTDPRPIPVLDDTQAELLARAALTFIVEPGDHIGAIVVNTLGAPRAALAMAVGIHSITRAEVAAIMEGITAAGRRVYTESTLESHWKNWTIRGQLADPEQYLEDIQELGGGLLLPSDPRWPARLNRLGVDTPLALWFLGDPDVLTAKKSLAVAGTRTATSYGQAVTRQLVFAAAEKRTLIVAGGGYGHEAAAHRAALSSRKGKTVAVLSGGLDAFIPTGNTDLLEEVARKGLVLSEIAPGSGSTRLRHLARTRVIAALSDAVLIVECREQSAAMETVENARELGLRVGVVPGPVTSELSRAPHALLKTRAAVTVTDPEDVLGLMA
ncbi:DNA-protecting protein DprA (plasmid) [Citricoccus nitrophenolicus]